MVELRVFIEKSTSDWQRESAEIGLVIVCAIQLAEDKYGLLFWILYGLTLDLLRSCDRVSVNSAICNGIDSANKKNYDGTDPYVTPM